MLDSYLDQLNEEILQEDPFSAAIGLGLVVGGLMRLFIGYNQKQIKESLTNNSKRAFEYEKPLGNVVGDSDWKIYKFDLPSKEDKKQNPDIPNDIPNAMVVSNTHEIFVTNGLLKILNQREVIAVLIHEAEHIKNNDVGNRAAYMSINIGLCVGASVIIPFLPLIMFIMLNFGYVFIGRHHETRADKSTVQYGYGRDLISALEKLEKWWIKNVGQRNEASAWLDVHPSAKKRVETLMTDVKTLEALANIKSPELMKKFLFKYIGMN